MYVYVNYSRSISFKFLPAFVCIHDSMVSKNKVSKILYKILSKSNQYSVMQQQILRSKGKSWHTMKSMRPSLYNSQTWNHPLQYVVWQTPFFINHITSLSQRIFQHLLCWFHFYYIFVIITCLPFPLLSTHWLWKSGSPLVSLKRYTNPNPPPPLSGLAVFNRHLWPASLYRKRGKEIYETYYRT